MRTTIMGSVWVLALLASGCGAPLETETLEATEMEALQGEMSTTATAVDFAFVQPTETGQEYIIRLTDPAKIAKARSVLANSDGWILVTGKVKKSKAAYNPNWSYLLEPASIQLVPEYDSPCKSSYYMDYVESRLPEVGSKSFLPDSIWCAGGSRLTREIKH